LTPHRIGPAVIKDKLSNHSYLVHINGAVKHIHADKLRKYHIQVSEVICDTVTTGHEQTRINHRAVIYDEDSDFGSVDHGLYGSTSCCINQWPK